MGLGDWINRNRRREDLEEQHTEIFHGEPEVSDLEECMTELGPNPGRRNVGARRVALGPSKKIYMSISHNYRNNDVKINVPGGEKHNGRVLVPVGAGGLIIGRGRRAGVQFIDTRVSRSQIEMTYKNGVIRARDLGSGNGTYLNNLILSCEPEIVYSGSNIKMGRGRLNLYFPRGHI